MTSTISEDALQGQQSRIMNALKAAAAPSQQQISPQDLVASIVNGNTPGGNYFDAIKQAQTTQAQGNLTAETGIYNQMKEMAARGNSNAAAIDKAISDVAGDDPKINATLAAQLHADPETITPNNVRQKVMKYAAEMGISPLSQQETEAKLAKTKAEAAKAQGEANQLNIFNPTNSVGATQGVPTVPQANGAPNSITTPNITGNTNEGYLSQLPTPVATQVKALAEGRMPFPSGFALKTPYWQQMLQAVSTYDPNFDAVNYNARSQTRKDFTSGKGAQNITALNTAMGHLDSLDKAFDGLKNSDYPIYNSVANAVARAAGKTNVQTALKDVNTKAIAVAGELAKVFRSTGMSSKEIDDWKEQISSNNSPAENRKVIESAVDLMNSRLDAIGQQYNQGMGTTKDPLQLLSSKAQNAYLRLSAKPDKVTKTEEPAPTSGPIADQIARSNPAKVVDYTEYFK